MKKLVIIFMILVLTALLSYAQKKIGSTPTKSKVNSPQAKLAGSKTQVKSTKPVDTDKPKRDTTKARKAAKIGNRIHREIQSTRGTWKKKRQSEVRMTEVKTKKGLRPDIISKSGRPFEIKPNTVTGYRKGWQQLKRQENVVGRRGGLFLYNPKTGKYQIKRTPFNEWQKRQQKIRLQKASQENRRKTRARVGF